MSLRLQQFVFIILFSPLLTPCSYASDPACEKGTLKGFEKCAENFLAKEDADLNTVYVELIELLPTNSTSADEVTKKDLVASQQAWQQYIRLTCGIQGALTRSSTEWINRTVSSCEANHSRDRTKELRIWLGCIKGEEDAGGSMCESL